MCIVSIPYNYTKLSTPFCHEWIKGSREMTLKSCQAISNISNISEQREMCRQELLKTAHNVRESGSKSIGLSSYNISINNTVCSFSIIMDGRQILAFSTETPSPIVWAVGYVFGLSSIQVLGLLKVLVGYALQWVSDKEICGLGWFNSFGLIEAKV